MKKVILALLFYSLCFIHVCSPEEFIYPVAQVDDKNVFVVHQKSIDDLNLFLWNIDNKVATKELSSMFLPSHIKMLPSKAGFSFIDRGRIRIKMFQKRAPKTIDILEPIHSIMATNWITDNQFYMVGKYKQHYKIFLCELLDFSYQMYHLTNFDAIDYIYSCKVEDSLFCIARNNEQDYFLMEQPWHPVKYGENYAHQPQAVIVKSKDPLCFLHMIDKQKGYFLRCNENQDDFLSFTCCSLIKEGTSWNETKLFSFQLPMKYLMGDSDQRAYESIYPFLPSYSHDQYIYFIHYNPALHRSCLYSYDIAKQTSTLINHIKRKDFEEKGSLSPILLNNSLCYGLILSSQKSIRSILEPDQETGIFNLNLPICMLEKKQIEPATCSK